MDPIERRRGSAAGALRVLARWVLLCAVIAAVFALHVLTAENDPGGHGGVPVAVASGHPLVVLSPTGSGEAGGGGAPTAAVSAAPGELEHPAGGEGLLAGCILFLVVAGPAALLALLVRRRVPEAARSAPEGWVRSARRGSSRPGVPRLALCVIRI